MLRIEIADETFHLVAKSEHAIEARCDIYVDSSCREQGRRDRIRELNPLKTGSQSHRVLGLSYAREGMVADAEREFESLLKENPNSAVRKKLMKGVRSWRRR